MIKILQKPQNSFSMREITWTEKYLGPCQISVVERPLAVSGKSAIILFNRNLNGTKYSRVD